MENITKEINKKFDNEFDFLKLYEAVYDKLNSSFKIVFLFPESVKEITKEQRQKLEAFLSEFLQINAKIELKFKKSFLDDDLIVKYLINYFKQNNFSLGSSVSVKNIKIAREMTEILVKFTFVKEIVEYINENNILLNLKEDIAKNFIATFRFEVQESEEKIDDSILEKRLNAVPKTKEKVVTRYPVYEAEKFFGVEINPFPEIIAEQKGEKTSVILAGEISGFTKKSYKSKRSKDPDALSYFYVFDIKDSTGTFPAIHFANKSTLKKMEAIVDGMNALFLGDIRKNIYGKLTLHIKAMAHCVIKKEEIKAAREESAKEKFFFSDEYQLIKPQPFVDSHQTNMFVTRKYKPLITDNTIVVFDVETTGLDADFAEIIEIGACKVVNGEIVETFESMAKPAKPIPTIITEITGINDEMVKDAPSITQVMTDFILFAGDSVLSGYNVNFDMRFIQKAAGNMGYHFNNQVEDAMKYARAQLRLGTYTLKNVSKNLDISLEGAHRALNDTIATARVLLKLNRED